MIIDEKVYLEHVGVKGMKWGVRKSEKSSSRNGSSGKNPILQTKLGELTPEQQLAVDASAIVGYFALKRAYNSIQSGDPHRLALKGKAFIDGKPYWDKNEKLASKTLDADAILSTVVKPVNSAYASHGFGTRGNCRRCTVAYEMRRRGYDVAATRTSNAAGQDVTGMYNVMNPGVKRVKPGFYQVSKTISREARNKARDTTVQTPFTDFRNRFGTAGMTKTKPEKLFESLAKEPDRSRGEVGVQWAMFGGHSMAYEIVNKKPIIFDAQSGKKYTSYDEFRKDFKGAVVEAGHTRLDNIPLNDDFMLRWLKDA